jgi:diketogulonate reductase-like aldo/keto reductase
VLPWCAANGVALVAYSPFGHDDFPGASTAGGKALAAIARAHGATPRQVALAALTRNDTVFAIPKASSAAHAEDNAGAMALALTSEDHAALDAAFPRGPRKRHLPML